MELSVIILHYNEEERIKKYYDKYFKLVDALKNLVNDFEVILEEDGSRDNTKNLLREIASKDGHFVLITHEKKLGKGGGLIKALEVSKGKYLIMLDADFPVPFETIENVYDYLRRGYDIVIPSRRHPKSRTRIPTLRRVFSFLFNVFVRILFKINVRDTQVGVKGFRRNVLEECLPRYLTGLSMDVEIIVRAWRRGYRILEIPTVYVHGEGEHVNVLRDAFRMGVDVLKLWASLRKEKS
ncbi:MAG: hypothetical protein DRN30_01325 [Thermoplasmata archaeon]|nr:glycosyltransferase [Euryarchaeota archaeon]RLF66882.1 MAG: hypothetical protein DRN30_01325 [Thermoplasmata archaeon]